VDPAVLESLVARLGERGPAFRTSLLRTWRDETAARLVDLDAAAAAGDADGVSRVAHPLTSSSAALGATELSAVCAQIEVSLRGGASGDLAALWPVS
jgi:HPt (histidine-containing phosphotransfer) domain-containing protein